jgi:hypothetical protein
MTKKSSKSETKEKKNEASGSKHSSVVQQSNRWDKFWFHFEVSQPILQTFHFFFYSLVGLDFWLQIHRAHKYMGSITLPQLFAKYYFMYFPKGIFTLIPGLPSSIIEELTDNRFLMHSVVASFVIGSFLSFRVAFGLGKSLEKVS